VYSKQAKIVSTKWLKMKEETSEAFKERSVKEGTSKKEDDVNNMCEKITTCIRNVASKV
jgi:hypothetical protein